MHPERHPHERARLCEARHVLFVAREVRVEARLVVQDPDLDDTVRNLRDGRPGGDGKRRLQLRVDMLNAFNHPNFANPVWANFGVDFAANGLDPTTGRGQGFLPLPATPDVGTGNPFLGGGGSRHIQLALRFSF